MLDHQVIHEDLAATILYFQLLHRRVAVEVAVALIL
jgi:hypothetical protein